jgi:hypothetical protein
VRRTFGVIVRPRSPEVCHNTVAEILRHVRIEARNRGSCRALEAGDSLAPFNGNASPARGPCGVWPRAVLSNSRDGPLVGIPRSPCEGQRQLDTINQSPSWTSSCRKTGTACKSNRLTVTLFSLYRMDQYTDKAPKRNLGGGDTRSAVAKVATATREEQIVALRLRRVSFAAIGRQIRISKQTAQRAHQKARRRNTDQDIQSHHRSELAELEVEQARIWRSLYGSEVDSVQTTATAMAALNRIHLRRAKLLGLSTRRRSLTTGVRHRHRGGVRRPPDARAGAGVVAGRRADPLVRDVRGGAEATQRAGGNHRESYR